MISHFITFHTGQLHTIDYKKALPREGFYINIVHRKSNYIQAIRRVIHIHSGAVSTNMKMLKANVEVPVRTYCW